MKFRSKLEQHVANTLAQSGVEFEYESDKVPYTLECNYNPDFKLPSGVFLEVKGYLDVDDRRKMIAVKKQNPDLDIRFVFQYPHRKIPYLKSTHAEWADKNQFLWCSYETIPESWLN